MSKMLTACAAIAVTAVVAWSGAANAAERQSNSVRNADQIETNAVVRHHQRRAQRPENAQARHRQYRDHDRAQSQPFAESSFRHFNRFRLFG